MKLHYFIVKLPGVSDLERFMDFLQSQEEVVNIWIFVFPPKQLSHQNWEASVISPKFYILVDLNLNLNLSFFGFFTKKITLIFSDYCSSTDQRDV